MLSKKKKKWLKWAKLSTLAAYESLSCLCFSHPWEIAWGKQKFLPVKFLVVLVLFISRINANTNKQCQSFISFYISLSMYVLNREFSNSGGKFNRKSWVMFPFLRSFIVVSIWWFLFFLYVLFGSLLKLRGFIFLVEDSRMTFFYDPACKLNHHKSNRKLKVKPSYVIYELNPHYSNITYAKCCKWETFSVRFVQVD